VSRAGRAWAWGGRAGPGGGRRRRGWWSRKWCRGRAGRQPGRRRQWAGRERRPGDGGVRVRPERERERKRVKGMSGSTSGRQDGWGVEELGEAPAAKEAAS
jgi:hypothetical protein